VTKRTEFGAASKGAHVQSAKGRVCAAQGCSTILSVYNALGVCSAHEVPKRRPATYRL
jgi:hypothetical protein